MSTNSAAIRDAIFARVSLLVPTGGTAWGTKRVVTSPTLNTTNLPILQVAFVQEFFTPDGDENVGPPRFVCDATISISTMRGFDDPAVLDGSADTDINNFLNTLLCDQTFVSPPDASPFYFEGVTRIENNRHLIQQAGEAYLIEQVLKMTFRTREFFAVVPVNALLEVNVSTPISGLALTGTGSKTRPTYIETTIPLSQTTPPAPENPDSGAEENASGFFSGGEPGSSE